MGFKLPGFGEKKTNIKEGMDRKYGIGEYSRGGKKFEERMKPGESKFSYDIRMRKEASKRATGTDITSSREIKGLRLTSKEKKEPKFSTDLGRKWNPLTKKFESTFDISEVGLNVPETKFNPNDLTDKSKPQNFGIIPGMTFSEAFAQAGKGGARAGIDPFFWINPKTGEEKSFLYDFEKKDDEIIEEKTEETPPVIEEVEEKKVNEEEVKLRFPELSKYHYKNSPSYTGQ